MLFDISQHRETHIDLPIIANNYTILHYDEFPMLFYGTNQYGNTIVGSLIGEDEENDIFRYLYMMAKPHDFVLFTKKEISYRELISKQTDVFLIDKTFEEEILRIYLLPLAEIPERFLPHQQVFCPDVSLSIGTDYVISMKGKLADIHAAFAERLTIISKGLTQIFTTLVNPVSNINNIETQIMQLAPTPTSFGINYRIKFNINSSDLFSADPDRENSLNQFVTSSLNYSINYLSKEAKQLADNKTDETQFQKLVEIPLKRAYNVIGQKYDEKVKERVLKSIMKIPSEMEKITDQLGLGFDYLEVNSVGLNNEKSLIGAVDQNFSREMDSAKDIIEAETEDVKFEEDFELLIHVYHLNVITKKGNAHVNVKTANGKDRLDSPKMELIGDGSLNGSDFINSMDTGGYISVRIKKAKKVNGRYKNLVIDF